MDAICPQCDQGIEYGQDAVLTMRSANYALRHPTFMHVRCFKVMQDDPRYKRAKQRLQAELALLLASLESVSIPWD